VTNCFPFKPYDPPADPHEIIKLVESMSDEEIEKNSERILKQHKLPNTYCFTKSLGEALIIEAREKYNLPALIFRPSIVVASMREPCPGYIDNINGPSITI
jgi:alcohol-forming fatty acyl-CoA reductase